jgi:TonB family protein
MSRCGGTIPESPVSESVMGILRRWMVASLLLAQILTAQEGTKPSARIICTPPTLKILKMVRPTFSPDAKAKARFGTVAVKVETDKMGKPSSVEVIKGDPVLAKTVLEAVRKWRWKPLMLNGVAVEAETTITVNLEPR